MQPSVPCRRWGVPCFLLAVMAVLAAAAAASVGAVPGHDVDPIRLTDWGHAGAASRACLSAVLIVNGSVVVVGGFTNTNFTEPSTAVTRYDVATGMPGKALMSLSAGIAGRTAAVVKKERIFVMGMCGVLPGSVDIATLTAADLQRFRTVEIIEAAARRTIVFNSTRPRVNATCVSWEDPQNNVDVIYVMGGAFLDDPSLLPVDRIDAFNSATETFAVASGHLPNALLHPAVAVTSASILVAGGLDFEGITVRMIYELFPLGGVRFCTRHRVIDPTLVSIQDGLDLQILHSAGWLQIFTDHGRLVSTVYIRTGFDNDGWNTTHLTDVAPRNGSSLIAVPMWTPGAAGDVATSIFRFGGVAWVSHEEPLPPTPAPTPAPPRTPTPPITPSLRVTPTHTVELPPTPTPTATSRTPTRSESGTATQGSRTASSLRTESSAKTETPRPTPSGSHAASLSPTLPVPHHSSGSSGNSSEAGGGGSSEDSDGSGRGPPPQQGGQARGRRLQQVDAAAASPGEITVIDQEVVPNVTVVRTNIRLPAPRLNHSSLFFTGSVITVDLRADPTRDGTHGCMSAEYTSCRVRLSTDPMCHSLVVDSLWYGQSLQLDLPATFAVTGQPLWLCFSFGDPPAYCYINGHQGPTMPSPFFPINMLYPLRRRAPQTPRPAAPPPPPPSGISKEVLLVIVISAAAIIAGLVVAVVVLRRKMSSGSSEVAQDSRYTELGVIGEGAFGKVLRVRRVADDAIFAKKHIECPSSEVLHEALKEFELLRTLQAHPNIVRVVDMFLNYEIEPLAPEKRESFSAQTPLLTRQQRDAPQRPTRHLCIVMDYHPLGDLKNWVLSRDDRVPEPVLCHIAVQTCSVLAFIHHKGILHRDLKPENILLVDPQPSPHSPGQHSSRGSRIFGSAHSEASNSAAANRCHQPIVVTDFGLAHLHSESHRNHAFVGTAVYSAPEAVAMLEKHHRPRSPASPATHGIRTPTSQHLAPDAAAGGVTSQSDMWSLGCVLYAIATKRVERACMRKMFEDVHKPGFDQDLRQELTAQCGYSLAYANFILRLLRVNPAERPTAKLAIKFFRKNQRDHSYHLTEKPKLLPGETMPTAVAQALNPEHPIGLLSSGHHRHRRRSPAHTPSRTPVHTPAHTPPHTPSTTPPPPPHGEEAEAEAEEEAEGVEGVGVAVGEEEEHVRVVSDTDMALRAAAHRSVNAGSDGAIPSDPR